MRSKIKTIFLLIIIFILSFPFIIMINNENINSILNAVRYLFNVFKIGKALPIISILVANIFNYMIKAIICFVILFLTLIVSFFIARSFLLYISKETYDYNNKDKYEDLLNIRENHITDIFAIMAFIIVILVPIVYTVISIIISFR